MRMPVVWPLLPLMMLMIAPQAVASATWRIDPARTRIAFTVDAVAWPQTNGTFSRFDGRISLDFQHPAASRVRFTVQAGSVEVGSSALNDYIRSPVFFDAARYPTMQFVSTAVEKRGPALAHVTGNLTLLGVTRPIALDVAVKRQDGGRRGQVGFTATGVIHRSEFGMNSGVPLISDAVHLTVTTEAREE